MGVAGEVVVLVGLAVRVRILRTVTLRSEDVAVGIVGLMSSE